MSCPLKVLSFSFTFTVVSLCLLSGIPYNKDKIYASELCMRGKELMKKDFVKIKGIKYCVEDFTSEKTFPKT